MTSPITEIVVIVMLGFLIALAFHVGMHEKKEKR